MIQLALNPIITVVVMHFYITEPLLQFISKPYFAFHWLVVIVVDISNGCNLSVN